ncbi:spermatogenesis associated 6-like protein isoform X2 [Clinocottus analis]|uniref:spermatogenesis associated 6-like protein isoform X2 n=1 Tax=Clinocottus analis TaxID=304258 RepID=UPI0035C061FB
MSRKALKVLVELKFHAVSCPGVYLPAKDEIYLSMCFMGQYSMSQCLPAVFPLWIHEKMTFEKIFRHAVDPGDIAVMLKYETVTIELVQRIPPVANLMACFEEDARSFLFPEPKLVPCSSGVDREVLMTRAPHFPGIAPRLEFSTKTTIIECSADAKINIYPNVLMRPVIKRNRRHSSRPRSSSPNRSQPLTLGRRQEDRCSNARNPSEAHRAQSLSPLRDADTQRLARLNLDSAANWDTSSTSLPVRASWPGACLFSSPQYSAMFTNSSSSLTRSGSKVRFSPTGRQKSSKVGGISEDNSSSSQTHDPLDYQQGPEPSGHSYRQQTSHSRSQSSSHREWEKVQARVRGLLTTPKAVSRLAYGATHSEVDRALARMSISPGTP